MSTAFYRTIWRKANSAMTAGWCRQGVLDQARSARLISVPLTAHLGVHDDDVCSRAAIHMLYANSICQHPCCHCS